MLFSERSAGPALVSLFSTCTLSLASSSGPGRPGPSLTVLSPPHASSLWLASLEHRTKTRPHTTPDWLAFQLTDTSSREADLISTL